MNQSNYKHYILFLDDEEKATKYFLKLFGAYFKILVTTDPNEAIKIINERSEEIAVFVSDQRMPNFSGVDLLAKMKEKNRNIVTVLTTAFASLENNIDAINKGKVFAYLTKPWDVEEVKSLLAKALDEFIARQNYISLSGSIAHEMRNPLNNVRQSSKMIKEKLFLAHQKERICGFGDEKITPLFKQDFSEIISSLDFVDNTVQRGNAIIDIILNNISGKSINANNLKNINAHAILEQVIKEYAFKDNEKNNVILDIESSEDFSIKCDENSLIYVFFNLIKNSLYYAQSRPDLKIKITTRKASNGFNEICVRDNGPGISQDKIDNLFGAFSTSGKKEGTGLGLAFCKRVMEELGGKINCNSKEGEGSFAEFILSFPRADIQIEDNFFNKILVVDGDENFLLSTKFLLEEKLNSTKCDTANSAIKVIDLIKKSEYSAILIDAKIAEINDFALVKEIREFDYTIPLIACCERDRDLVINNLKSGGFNDYISKKSSPKILLKMIAKWSLAKIVESLIIKDSEQNLLHHKKILIVDDEPVNLTLTSKYLDKYDAKIDKAKNGLEALNLVRKNKYDLILMDIQMPELDGLETIQEIKKLQQNDASVNDNLLGAIIIAVTGDNSKAQIYKILNAGFDDYFTKGNDYSDLSEMMEFWGAIHQI